MERHHPNRQLRRTTHRRQHRQSGRNVTTIKLAKAVADSHIERTSRKIIGYQLECLSIQAFRNYDGDLDPKSMQSHLFAHSTKAVHSPIPDTTGQSSSSTLTWEPRVLAYGDEPQHCLAGIHRGDMSVAVRQGVRGQGTVWRGPDAVEMDEEECGGHAGKVLTACGRGVGSDFQRRPRARPQETSLAQLGRILSGLVDRSNTEGDIRKGVAGRAIMPGQRGTGFPGAGVWTDAV